VIPKVKEWIRLQGGPYGSRRIARGLESTGNHCGKHKGGTLMRLAVVQSKTARQGCITPGDLATKSFSWSDISFRPRKSILPVMNFNNCSDAMWNTVKQEQKG
jgi:hypothetical protein